MKQHKIPLPQTKGCVSTQNFPSVGGKILCAHLAKNKKSPSLIRRRVCSFIWYQCLRGAAGLHWLLRWSPISQPHSMHSWTVGASPDSSSLWARFGSRTMGSRSRCVVTAMTVMHIGVTLPSLGTRLWAFGYTPTLEFVPMLLHWNEQPDSLIAVHDTGLQTMYRCAKHHRFISPWKPVLKDSFIFTRYSWATLPVPGEFLPLTGTHLLNRVGPSAARGDQAWLQ